MIERPIIFSTEMVNANLDGRKTMTRRIVKPQPDHFHKFGNGPMLPQKGEVEISCPYGRVGDLLWVRETFKQVSHYAFFDDTIFQFKADGKTTMPQLNHPDADIDQCIDMSAWKPSIHMPKAIARIWLMIEGIRIERLNTISEDDAINEGVLEFEDGTYKNYFTQKGLRAIDGVDCLLAKGSFQSLWCSINGLDSWEASPWVWVIKFKVISTTGKPKNLIVTI